jgi:YggT family protein
VHGLAFAAFWVLQLWVLCAVLRAIMSWFPIRYDSAAYRLNGVLARITEPVIAPVRRLVRPVGVGGVGLDLSFIIVVLVAQLVAAQLRNYALG